MRMHGRIGLSLFILLSLALAGCWDYRDIENRALIMGLAVDRAELGDGYVVTAEIPRTQQQEATSGAAPDGKILISHASRTIGEGLLQLTPGQLGRLPVWEQVIVMLVSPEVLIERGLEPILDLLLRTTRMNSRIRIFAVDGRAAEALEVEPQFQPLSSLFFFSVEDQYSRSPFFPRPRTAMYLANRLVEGSTILLPRIAIENGTLQVSGAAVLVDGMWQAWLDAEAAFGVNWLLGAVEQAVLVAECPQGKGGMFTVEVEQANRYFDSTVTNTGPKFSWEYTVATRLIDLQDCEIDPGVSSDIRRLEERTAATLQQKMLAAWDLVQSELGIDVLNLEAELRRRHPAVWREIDWSVVYPTVDVDVHVTVRLESVGATMRPQGDW